MDSETLIANYLIAHYPLAQIKSRMYHPDDIYYRIPVLVFRFDKLINTDIYIELEQCLENYKGRLSWTVFESFYGKKIRNYIICPYEVYQMKKNCYDKKITISSLEYFTESKYKTLCEDAIEDIPLLYVHIKSYFKPDIKKYFDIDKVSIFN